MRLVNILIRFISKRGEQGVSIRIVNNAPVGGCRYPKMMVHYCLYAYQILKSLFKFVSGLLSDRFLHPEKNMMNEFPFKTAA